MTEKDKQPKSILSGNVLREMGDYLRLVLRLMGDSRINPLLKLLPIGGIIYMFSPLDAMVPYIDDIGVIGLAMYMFVEMCPPGIVEEHRQALRGVVTSVARDPESKNRQPYNDDEIVDAEFREEK